MFKQSKRKWMMHGFCAWLMLLSAECFAQYNPYNGYSVGQLNSRLRALEASRMDIVRRGAVQEMLAANREVDLLSVTLLSKRNYYLQNDLPDEPDNPFLSRRKVLTRMNRTQSRQDLYRLEGEISAEINQLFQITGGAPLPYAQACIRSLQSLQELIYRKYSFGELNNRLRAVDASRMDIVRRGAVHEMLAANKTMELLTAALLLKRSDYLLNDLPDDPDNPFLTRRKFFRCMNNARNWQELYQLSEAITAEIMRIDGRTPAGSQCISSLQSLRNLITGEVQRRFPSDWQKYRDVSLQNMRQRVQTAAAMEGMVSSSAQTTTSQRQLQRNRNAVYKVKCWTHGIEYDGRFGCPQCRAPNYGGFRSVPDLKKDVPQQYFKH